MRGRKPKPAALRLIEGNREHRPILPEPKPSPDKPRCPKYLKGEARKAFRLIAGELGRMNLLHRSDTYVIVALAIAAGNLADSRRRWQEEGAKMTVEIGEGKPGIQNPLLGIMHRSIDKISRLSAQLGLDPTARARLIMPQAKEKSLREELLG